MGNSLIKTCSRKLVASFQSSVGLGSYEVLNNEKILWRILRQGRRNMAFLN